MHCVATWRKTDRIIMKETQAITSRRRTVQKKQGTYYGSPVGGFANKH